MTNLGFSCCSINCRGLQDVEKRKDVFNFLRSKKYSVYLLQDTHFVKDQEPIIRAQWGFDCIFNSKNSQSRGVAILFNKNLDYTIHKKILDDNGNLIILDITICDKRLTLVNIYGPNQDSPEFYEKVKAEASVKIDTRLWVNSFIWVEKTVLDCKGH